MKNLTHSSLMQSERALMEGVYRSLSKQENEASSEAKRKKQYRDSGAYEYQYEASARADYQHAEEKSQLASAMIRKLYAKPYFAHIETVDDDDNTEHYFLSDSEALHEMISIASMGEEEGFLLPFKKDAERPLIACLFHFYQAKNGAGLTYTGNNGQRFSLQPVLICNDDIENRVLRNAMALFPSVDSEDIDADEFLMNRLQENRNDPVLRNIIATLQQQQFEIIRTDTTTSFVVQGCPGSGKSQCMLHRLFYLRDELSQNDWRQVLLLTPTQLFRNHSADLMRRYELTSIKNFSLSEMYRDLLLEIDPRFKGRQYIFELSEEHLPDGYLQQVYSSEVIRQVDDAVTHSLTACINSICTLLHRPPARPSAALRAELSKQLQEKIAELNAVVDGLKNNHEYSVIKARMTAAHKKLAAEEKNLQKWTEERDAAKQAYDDFSRRKRELEEAAAELTAWKQTRNVRIAQACKELSDAEAYLQDANCSPEAPALYGQKLAVLNSLLCGEMYEQDETHLHFLAEYNKAAQDELASVLEGQTAERTAKRLAKKLETASGKMAETIEALKHANSELDFCDGWLTRQTGSSDASSKTQLLAELTKAETALSRLESTIFERDVWQSLLPIKQQYGVQSVKESRDKDGRVTEDKILYKSDLLFYIKLYKALGYETDNDKYNIICIDEGQDLHKEDYSLLKLLYPKAVFNVFGDRSQILHDACGISDWKQDTGIQQIYSLNKNYRNTADIVSFCNKELGSSMDFLGKPSANAGKLRVSSALELRKLLQKRCTVIVKDKACFEQLCLDSNFFENDFDYMDTHAAKPSGRGIPCYTIFAAKGLEFNEVLVYSRNMTNNQKVVACTRAMESLHYYE